MVVAYNLPGIGVILGVDQFKDKLLSTLKQLAKDDSEDVRCRIAISLHEVYKVFCEKKKISILEPILFGLM